MFSTNPCYQCQVHGLRLGEYCCWFRSCQRACVQDATYRGIRNFRSAEMEISMLTILLAFPAFSTQNRYSGAYKTRMRKTSGKLI